MDPDAIWRMICESLHDLKKDPNNPDTRKHAIDCLQVLATWLYRGGFPPSLARLEQDGAPAASAGKFTVSVQRVCRNRAKAVIGGSCRYQVASTALGSTEQPLYGSPADA